MFKHLKTFENALVKVLLFLMVAVILFAVAGLFWVILQKILSAPALLLEVADLLDIFGFFLLILIGVELMETIKAYLTDRTIRVEVVLLVSIIAVARKVIILDPKQFSGLTLIGVGVLIITLATGYHLIRRTHEQHGQSQDD